MLYLGTRVPQSELDPYKVDRDGSIIGDNKDPKGGHDEQYFVLVQSARLWCVCSPCYDLIMLIQLFSCFWVTLMV